MLDLLILVMKSGNDSDVLCMGPTIGSCYMVSLNLYYLVDSRSSLITLVTMWHVF